MKLELAIKGRCKGTFFGGTVWRCGSGGRGRIETVNREKEVPVPREPARLRKTETFREEAL